MSVYRIKSVSKVNYQNIFSLGWGFSIKHRNHVRPIQCPYGAYTYLSTAVLCLTWFEGMACGTFCGQPAESNAYSDRMKSFTGLFQHNWFRIKEVRPKFERYFFFKNHVHKIGYGSNKCHSCLPVRIGSQILQNFGRNAIQPYTRAAGEGHESLVDKKLGGWKTIDICGVLMRINVCV